MSSAFAKGQLYTRDEVGDVLGFPTDQRRGGVWMTGYVRWNGEIVIFCNVGAAGRTGHDYPNRWFGKELIWYGKTASSLRQPLIREMVEGNSSVHIFWRGSDRSPFTYAGLGHALTVQDTIPVEITWTFEDLPGSPAPANESNSPVFRRGPPPVAGTQSLTKVDGHTSVYLMVLTGPARELFPNMTADETFVKVGMTNSTKRRKQELNAGFPPGCTLKWEVVQERVLGSGAEAYACEQQVLERLRIAKFWIGGEFARVPSGLVPSLLD